MRLLLIIPDGVGIRNFLLGPFFQQAIAEGDVHLLHTGKRDVLEPNIPQIKASAIQWHQLIKNGEGTPSVSLRHALAHSLTYAHMYWADTFCMRYKLSKPKGESRRARAGHTIARLIGRMASSPRGIQELDKWHCRVVERTPEVEHYRQLFRRIRPSVLFCSNQQPPQILSPVLAARSLGIPTATFIFSWDNLTSKGRIAAPFDHYLVWSDHMRSELTRYYPDVPHHCIHVVGTPQFDPYAERSLIWSRTEFMNRVGADPLRPLICYSGAPPHTSPDDPQYVKTLMELIRAGRIKKNPQVLIRPAPADDGRRYDKIRRDYPELIYVPPIWLNPEPGDWSKLIPLAEDNQFLANLTHHADLNINVASTMTLDFAIHDKPIVNIAFDMTIPPVFGSPLWDLYYRYEHYRPVVELGAARFARSVEELSTHVNSYLENPALDREGRRLLAELEVGQPIGEAGNCILQVLQRISRN